MNTIEIKITATETEKGFNVKTIVPKHLLITEYVAILESVRDAIAISVKSELEKRNATTIKTQQKIILGLKIIDLTD